MQLLRFTLNKFHNVTCTQLGKSHGAFAKTMDKECAGEWCIIFDGPLRQCALIE
jgi:hypothetical protein